MSDAEKSRFGRRLLPSRSPDVMLALLAACLVLSPVSTKMAGAAWLVVSVWGLARLFVPCRVGVDKGFDHAGAARFWLVACVLSTLLAAFALGWWHDPWDELNTPLRLLFGALGVYLIIARGAPLPRCLRHRCGDVLAAACVAAFACILFLTLRDPFPRNLLPANAIVWALAVAFMLGLLASLAAWEAVSTVRQRWWMLGLLAGSAAVVLSQSRSALAIFPWMAWVLVVRWRRVHGTWPLARIAGLLMAACVVLAAAWFAPGDPLRMQVARHDISKVENADNYNTSMGTRLYLWALACRGISESPWLGIGQKAALSRIHHVGDELPPAERGRLSYVRTMGHVHNDFLNAALDGGVPGLASVLVLIGALLVLAHRFSKSDSLAAQQLRGVAFIVVTAGLTNVNFAHNYYAVTLSLVLAIILLGAAFSRPGDPPPAP